MSLVVSFNRLTPQSDETPPRRVCADTVPVGQLFVDRSGFLYQRVDYGALLFKRDAIIAYTNKELNTFPDMQTVQPIEGRVNYQVLTDHPHRFATDETQN